VSASNVNDLPTDYRNFTAAFAGFWCSHAPRAARRAFIESLHEALTAGAIVVALDNRYVEGSSTLISHVDADGNSYQRNPPPPRRLRGTGSLAYRKRAFPPTTPRELSYRRTTRVFADVIAKSGPAVMTLPGVVASPGGIPIMSGGKVIGGVGVSGVTGDQDEQCAKAGLAAM